VRGFVRLTNPTVRLFSFSPLNAGVKAVVTKSGKIVSFHEIRLLCFSARIGIA